MKKPLTAPTSELYFRYSKPPTTGNTMMLLTTGFTLTQGAWMGEPGDFFIGWCPVPKRDKQAELAVLVAARDRRIAAAQAKYNATQHPLDRAVLSALLSSPVPGAEAVPKEQDQDSRTLLLAAASHSGDPGAIALAAQLTGATPCPVCDFVENKCQCEGTEGSQDS